MTPDPVRRAFKNQSPSSSPSLSWTVTRVVAVAFEPELLQVSVNVVAYLMGPVLFVPVAARFERFKPPPVIAQDVGFAVVVDALQDRVDAFPL